MKWELANQSNTAISKYQLSEGDDVKMELKYSPAQHSVRISSEGSHRLFFIDKTGLWHNKTILKNEYGVEIGRLALDSIEVEGKKYQYAIRQSQLVLFEQRIATPLAEVEMSVQPGTDEFACFLLGLCWYLADQLIYATA